MSDYNQQQPYIYRQTSTPTNTATNNDDDGRKQLAQYEIDQLSSSSFVKGLISAIICGMPIASMFAIFLGSGAVSKANEAFYIAEQYNLAKGKAVAGKILGKVGQITGIVMSLWWGLYIIMFFLAIIGIGMG